MALLPPWVHGPTPAPVEQCNTHGTQWQLSEVKGQASPARPLDTAPRLHAICAAFAPPESPQNTHFFAECSLNKDQRKQDEDGGIDWGVGRAIAATRTKKTREREGGTEGNEEREAGILTGEELVHATVRRVQKHIRNSSYSIEINRKMSYTWSNWVIENDLNKKKKTEAPGFIIIK